MFSGRLKAGLFASSLAGVLGVGMTLAANGCTTEPWHATVYCYPDASPDADINGDCFPPDGGNSVEPLSCKAAGGECVPMGTSDFRERAVLLWMGDEYNAPQCPERASSDFYSGYGDLVVSWECSECACSPAECSMPESLEVHSASFCQGGNGNAYSGPSGWDGACVSPSVLPKGSFSSIKLNPATVAPCEPVGDPIPKAPGFRSSPSSFANGIYWGTYAKACQGTAAGACENTGDLCLSTSEPPPPGFRQCVQYTLPVDETNLPKCPDAFPDRFTFYSGTKGSVECTPCQCGEPIGAECAVSFSAYQDPACAGVPMPLFQNVPASPNLCIDFGGVPYPLGSMEAKWVKNTPGTCEPIGGELIGDVKAVDPRVFCCQLPPSPSPQ